MNDAGCYLLRTCYFSRHCAKELLYFVSFVSHNLTEQLLSPFNRYRDLSTRVKLLKLTLEQLLATSRTRTEIQDCLYLKPEPSTSVK